MLGLDLTEAQFDIRNAEITALCNADGLPCDSYAGKTNPTIKGFWMQIVNGYEDYFTQTEITNSVEYIPLETLNEFDV